MLQQADGLSGPAQSYQNDAYFALIRNCRRHAWVLLYLFGASPAVCGSFVAGSSHELQELGRNTLYLPYSTSLRMGPLGYQSDAQASLAVSYNDLESYARSLYRALTEPYPPYAAIGIHGGHEYRQLATTLLQIENEFYTTVRPKRIIRRGERPLHALSERGVEYVEVRCLDLDPYCPVGIDVRTMRFLDIFLLHCLLTDSPPDTPTGLVALSRNRYDVAQRGRDPDLRLLREGETVTLRDWAAELLRECEPIAGALDEAHGVDAYNDALLSAVQAFVDPSATPSARMLRDIEQLYGKSYVRFALAHSVAHRNGVLALPLSTEVAARYARMAEESLVAQHEIEAKDDVPFETYRQRYLTQDLLSGTGF
jgi:glutamate--cysteine ligase